jgi:MFS family permease
MAVQSQTFERSLAGTAPLFGAYLVFGVFWGVWVVVFADWLAAQHITEGGAGLRLAALSATAIVTMTLVAPRLQRVRLGVTIPAGLLVFALGPLLLGTASGPGVTLGFAAIGVGNGLIDVFVNVGGQIVEARRRRPVLQYIHASYNTGGIVGALLAGALLAAGVDYRWPLALSACLFVIVGIWCARAPSLRERPDPASAASKVSLAVFVRSPFLIVPAMVMLSAFFVEGSMDIWSVIYLRETLTASAFAGGIAFAAFSLAMAIGRVTAARVLFGLGYRTTLLVSGAGTLASGAVAALASGAAVAGVAFLFLGFFIASAAPAVFGLVADADVDPVLAIAGITTVGYIGFVVGPPFMGALAEHVGLRATMALLVATGIGVAIGGVLAPRDDRRRSREPAPDR